jgi:carbamate kinase
VERLLVAALGGNAIQRAHEAGSAAQARRNLARAARHLASFVEAGWRLVVTHGNGPQVGQLLIQQEAAGGEVPPLPLDVLVAMTEGWLGYLLAEALDRELDARGRKERCAPVLMRALVDPRDPAFGKPTKPVGPHFTAKEAARLAKERGWTMREVASGRVSNTWRRVVPSPRPLALIDLPSVRALLAHGMVPVTVGGGGVPVARGPQGHLRGVEGVIDKDLASGLLAAELGAACFLILTDVEKVASGYGTPDQANIDRMSVSEARQWAAEGQFPPGSMKTKVEGAILYLERGGRLSVISHLDAAGRALEGKTGTRIVPDRPGR